MANRFFYAVPLPSPIRNRIVAAQRVVRESAGDALRLVKPENLHITLHFIGNLPTSESLETVLSEPLGQEFEVGVGGGGFFPSARRPRVGWIGVRDLSGGLSDLHTEIGRRLTAARLSVEPRTYSPHISIGYVRKRATREEVEKVRSKVPGILSGEIGVFQVDRVALLNSRTAPGGSIYTVVSEATLSED